MRKVSTTLIAISMLFAISLFIIGCDDDNNGIQPGLGSDISRACAGQFDGFISGWGRSSTCLCEGEFRGEFSLELGPAPDPEDPLIITMGEATSEGGRTIFGVEEKGGSTFSLFNVEPDPDVDGGLTLVGDPVGELQNLIEGISSLEFVIQLGDDPPERVVCPACAIAEVCDLEEELDKPKCLDSETLVDTGSSCPADSIVRVCDPFLCGAEVVVEETGEIISVDFITLPFENDVALGCNTINESGIYYTNIENIPPSGTYIESGTGEGTFSCELSPSPTPTPQCLTLEELANTDCPAEALPQSCDTFYCGICYEGGPCGNVFFTPSEELPSDCQVVDCNTLDCGKRGTFNNLQISEGLGPSWTENFDVGPYPQATTICHGAITASPTPTP